MPSTSITAYQRLITSSHLVEDVCRCPDNGLGAGKIIRLNPSIGLDLVDQDLSLPEDIWSNPSVYRYRLQVEALLKDQARKVQCNVQALCEAALRRTLSLEDGAGIDDLELQRMIQKGFQHRYRTQIVRLRTAVIEQIRGFIDQKRKTAGFASVRAGFADNVVLHCV